MTTIPDELVWAEKLVGDGAVVLHLETGIISRCKGLLEPGKSIGANGKPCQSWAMKLDDGSTLVVEGEDREQVFVRLEDSAARFYVVMVNALSNCLKEATHLAIGIKLTKELTVQLLISAIEAQVRALRRTPLPRADEPPPAPSSPA